MGLIAFRASRCPGRAVEVPSDRRCKSFQARISLWLQADGRVRHSRPMPTFDNFIDGTWCASTGRERFENRNPADADDLIGTFPQSTGADVDAAVAAAAKAYRSWRLVPAPRRGEILFRAAQIIADRKEELAREMTREMGKVLDETRGDVQEAIDMTFFMAGEGRRQYGQTVPSELRDKFAMSIRQPVGVCSVITPWNFPMAIPSWKIIPALVCGNTVVFKPASLTPLSAVRFVRNPRGGRSAAGSGQPGHRRRQRWGACSPRIRGLASSRSPGRPQLDGSLPRRLPRPSRRCTSRWAARTSSWSWMTPTLIWRSTAASGAALAPPASGARPPAGSSSTPASIGPSSTVSSPGCERCGSGTGWRRPLRWARASARDSGRRSCAMSRSARPKAPPLSAAAGRCRTAPWAAATFTNRPFSADVTACDADCAGGDFRSGCLGAAVRLARRSDCDRQRRAVRVVGFDLHAGRQPRRSPRCGISTPASFMSTLRRLAPRSICRLAAPRSTGNGHREAGTAALDVFSEWKSIYVDFSGRLQRAQIDTAEPFVAR